MAGARLDANPRTVRAPVPLNARRYDLGSDATARLEVAPPAPSAPIASRTACFDPLRGRDRTKPYRNAYWGLSGSLLPNVGIALEVGGVYRRSRDICWAWDGEFTWQFIDDEVFADDGNPAARNWFQVQAGMKISTHASTRRHFTGRWGAAWFYAEGEPNIVTAEGHYFGIYGGIGYETDLTPCLTMGPELSVMVVMHEEGKIEAVPQFNWHVIWNF